MTSRRSMLKWIPAACVGGWAGLFGKAGAAATTTAQPPAAPPPDQPPAADVSSSSAIITHTYYDADGRVVAEYRECPAWRPTFIR